MKKKTGQNASHEDEIRDKPRKKRGRTLVIGGHPTIILKKKKKRFFVGYYRFTVSSHVMCFIIIIVICAGKVCGVNVYI